MGIMEARGQRLGYQPALDGLRSGTTPRAVGLLIVTLALLVVWARAEEHGLDAFTIVGDEYMEQAPAGLDRVFDGPGYDGQYFYMLALDPTGAFLAERNGWPAYRHQRIGYPLLGWALSAGIPDLVPYAMLATNLLALAVVGWAGAKIATGVGRHPAWGLLLAVWPGFLISMSRGTSEIVAAAAVLTGLAMMRERRDWLAAAAFTAALLTRETMLLLVGPALLVALWHDGPRRAGRYLLPLAIWATWQVALTVRWGEVPVLSRSDVIETPIVGLVESSAGWDMYGWVLAGTLVVAVLAGAVTCLARRQVTVPALALPMCAAILFSMSSVVWVEPHAFLRGGTELFLAAAVAVLALPVIYRMLALVVAVGWASGLLLVLQQL